MKTQNVTKFDLASAFKALDDIETPIVSSKPRLDRPVSLTESVRGIDMTSELLEDYYNVYNHEDLKQAEADREAEIAKAKLAKIEKIVDLDAETEADVQPSYVGKTIVQCPQCMTLFYRNPADLVATEDDPNTVNAGEVCPNCGHKDGYIVIGKVAAEEAEPERPEESATEDPTTEEPTSDATSAEETPEELPAADETPAEDTAAETTEEDHAENTDEDTAELEPVSVDEDETAEEEKDEEEEVKESFTPKGYPYTFNEAVNSPVDEDVVEFAVEEGNEFDKAIKK